LNLELFFGPEVEFFQPTFSVLFSVETQARACLQALQALGALKLLSCYVNSTAFPLPD
jgi:hypothetical protein